MRAWLLHIGEDLPVDGTQRTFRYGYLAQALAARGHQVLRWAPTFRHQAKVHRFSSDRRIDIEPNYTIQFVHSPGYRRNAGIQRLRAYRILGNRFRRLAESDTPPDVIVAAIPSLEWAEAATNYGRCHGVPVVIDVRDLWPDVFLNALPKTARRFGRIPLAHYERAANRACARATALTAVSPSYLQWALKKAGRQMRPHDRVVPIGFEPEVLPESVMQLNLLVLRNRGIDPSLPTCVFSGEFERSYDLETVLKAARKIQTEGSPVVQFIFCGDGSQMPMLKRQAVGLPHVHFLGWVNAPMLQAALTISSIGLCAYADDALQSLPNKPFEYMSNSLDILSSLSGDLAELLHRHQCGLTYRAGDADSLAQAVAELVNDPRRLSEMRGNGYQAWFENYRSEIIYSRFVRQLENLTCAAAKAA